MNNGLNLVINALIVALYFILKIYNGTGHIILYCPNEKLYFYMIRFALLLIFLLINKVHYFGKWSTRIKESNVSFGLVFTLAIGLNFQRSIVEIGWKYVLFDIFLTIFTIILWGFKPEKDRYR